MVQKGANDLDAGIASLAAAQHGVITTGQLRRLGLSIEAVSQRARRGKLHRLHRSVYAVGHAGLPREGQWMAAVLAIGADAVLSHRSAAELWSLLPSLPVFLTSPSRPETAAGSATASGSTALARSRHPTVPSV